MNGQVTIYPDDLEFFNRAKKLAFETAEHFELSLKVFQHKKRPDPSESMGYCNVIKGEISVVFRCRYNKNCSLRDKAGKWLKNSLPEEHVLSIIAHELAHLKHPNHSKEFWEYNKTIVVYLIQVTGKQVFCS